MILFPTSHQVWPQIDGFVHTIYLVGGIPTPLKNMKVSWGFYYSQLNGKIEHVPVTTNQLSH